jgi:hypothetical protein
MGDLLAAHFRDSRTLHALRRCNGGLQTAIFPVAPSMAH